MAVFSKEFLAGTGDGTQMVLAQTVSGSAETVHTVPASVIDEVWLYATNNDASSVNLTILLGGTTNPDDYIQLGVPAKSGLTLVVPGLPLDEALVIKAFASVASKISLSGYVNRIT